MQDTIHCFLEKEKAFPNMRLGGDVCLESAYLLSGSGLEDQRRTLFDGKFPHQFFVIVV